MFLPSHNCHSGYLFAAAIDPDVSGFWTLTEKGEQKRNN